MANWWDAAPLAQQQANWWDTAPVAQPPARAVSAQEMADELNLPVPGTDWRTPEQPERYQSPVPGGDALNAFSAAFGESIPIAGPLVTHASDFVGSNIVSMITGRPAEELRAEADRMRQQRRSDNPIPTALGTVAGSVGPLMALGTTQLGGQALGITGSLPQRMVAGGLSGFGLAFGDEVARGSDFSEAGMTGAAGAGIGAAFPLAERTMSPMLRLLLGQNVPAQTSAVARNLERDGIDPASIPGRLDALGPDALPLDLGSNLTRQGAAIASLPGEGQSIMRNAVVNRQQGANARIQADVDATLGPSTGPRAFDAQINEAQRGLSPLYEDAFANARAVDTDAIALNLDSLAVRERGEAQSVAQRLRNMLSVVGTDELDRDPRTLFAVRRAIDGMRDTTLDGNVNRILSQTRREVDALLEQSVPGIKDADRQFADLARQREAYQLGQSALDSQRTSLTPVDLAELASGSNETFMAALSQGARADIDRIIGTTANNITALKSALKGDGSWNRERLRVLFGQQNADRLLGVLEREQTYAQGYQAIVGNSETAARAAAQREAQPRQFDFDWQRILFGLPQGAANMAARSRSENVNRAIAEMLTGRPTAQQIDQLLAARRADRGLYGASAVPLLTGGGG